MPTTTAPTIQSKFDTLDAMLNAEMVERRAEIRALITALVAGGHMFLLGPPGVAKSMLITRAAKWIGGVSPFEVLMTRFSTMDEVFGPVSLRALEDDRYERNIDGFLPTAELAFIDEIWKANSSILNALLWALNERHYRHGTDVMDIPLSTMLCASNELAQDESLKALFDRIHFRFVVGPVRDNTRFLQMLQTTRPANPEPVIDWAEIEQAKTEARDVIVPTDVLEAVADLRKKLKEKSIEPSERRFVQALDIVRANAWLDECATADIEHLQPLQHMLWEIPEQFAEVSGLVLAVANPLDAKAQTLLQQIDGLEAELDEISDDADQRHQKGTELHGKLQRAKQELDDIESRAGKGRRRSEMIADCRDRLHSVTSRTLREIFKLDEEAANAAASE